MVFYYRITFSLADGGGFEPLMLTYVKAIKCLYYTVYIQDFSNIAQIFLPPLPIKKSFCPSAKFSNFHRVELFLKHQLFSNCCSIEAEKIDPLFFWFGIFSKSHFENCRRFFAFKKRELQKSQEAQRGSNNQPLRSSEIMKPVPTLVPWMLSLLPQLICLF